MRRSTGFSLVEALVALVVISFGLLGVATMQLKALEGAHVGYRHSLVSLMAIDAQERVWKSLADNSGNCPKGTADGTTLKNINDAWLEYWFDTANLGFTVPEVLEDPDDPNYPITKVERQDDPDGKICQYRVLVSWEALPYSIYEEANNDDGGNGGNGGGGQQATAPEEVRQLEYVFRVPQT